MGSIISLVSQKGGVGKSGIARLLAVEFARAGWSVKIADLDTMQGTSTKWKIRRDAAKLLIIDGPAHAEKGGLAMARKSKLILMPTCYGLDDLEAQVEAAYELEVNGIERSNIWFVFARTTGSPNEEQAAREYLQRADINMLEPLFAEQPCIRQAHNAGKAASEVSFPIVRERAVALALAVATKVNAVAGDKPVTENIEAA